MKHLILTSIIMAGVAGSSAFGQYTGSKSGSCPGTVTLTWQGATPNHIQGLVRGDAIGSTFIPNGACAGTRLGITVNVRLITTLPTGNGSGSVNGQVGSQGCGGVFQWIEGGTCQTSNVF